MDVSISLENLSDGYREEVIVNDIEDRRCFSYLDNNSDTCKICIYDEGICLFKRSKDYLLELHLDGENYISVSTQEGLLKFDAKVVDFTINNDILVMHYIVNDEARIIKIKYI